MKRKLNPDVHLICGKCGCGTMFSFELSIDSIDDGEGQYPAVYLSCGNCGTLTGLEEISKDKTNWNELGMYTKYEDE